MEKKRKILSISKQWKCSLPLSVLHILPWQGPGWRSASHQSGPVSWSQRRSFLKTSMRGIEVDEVKAWVRAITQRVYVNSRKAKILKARQAYIKAPNVPMCREDVLLAKMVRVGAAESKTEKSWCFNSIFSGMASIARSAFSTAYER